MTPDPDLALAYQQTAYVLRAGALQTTLRLQKRSFELDRFLRLFSWRKAFFITASNPFSRQKSADWNLWADRQLRRVLKAQKRSFVSGYALPEDSPTWPIEPGYWLFDVSKQEAWSLGKRFRQEALVMYSYGHEAELLWLKHSREPIHVRRFSKR